VKKVLLDQFIQAPIFTVVIFAFLDVLEGKNWEGVQAQIKRDFWCVRACVRACVHACVPRGCGEI